MKKVMVTGGKGFIGRHCLPLLIDKGYEVHAVDVNAAEAGFPDVTFHTIDLLEPGQVSTLMSQVRPMCFLHLAWYAVPGKFWTSVENFRWVQASLNLLQAFVSNGGHRVVMAGTCAEYDWRYGFCSEEITPLLPATPYGAYKHSLQVMLDAFSRQTGLSRAWGRVFFLYGPHEHPERLVSSVIGSVLKGDPALCSHGNQIRDFLYVEDVASAFVNTMDSTVQGPVNIASGRPISLREVIIKIGEKAGRPDLIRLGEKAVSEDEPSLLIADVKKLTEDVNWFARYTLDEGIDKTIRWWKDHLWIGNGEK
jgi:nucleoside-diphosphate-sugar epimerase